MISYGFPDQEKHVINVYTQSGEHDYQIKLPNFTRFPRMIKDISENEIMVAAETGLFIMQAEGMTTYKISSGNFTDLLRVHEETILTFDHNLKEMRTCSYVNDTWQIVNPEFCEKTEKSDSDPSACNHFKDVYQKMKTSSINHIPIMDNNLWMPDNIQRHIQVVDKIGEDTSGIKLPQFIGSVQMIKVVSDLDIVLVSDTGLYVMDRMGKLVLYKITSGNFSNLI